MNARPSLIKIVALWRNLKQSRAQAHPHNIQNARLPAIYLHSKGKLSLPVTRDAINRRRTLRDLTDLVDQKLGSAHH